MYVTEVREHGYFHLYARVCTQKYESGDWRPWGLDDERYGRSKDLLYSGLRVSCQGDDQSQTRDSESVYGFSVEYRDVWSIDREKAERMHRTLDRLHKGLEKLYEARGYVRTYGEYVGRVAEVLGCAGIGIERDARRSRYESGRTCEWMSVGDGVDRVNGRVQHWVNEATPAERTKPATEASGTADEATEEQAS